MEQNSGLIGKIRTSPLDQASDHARLVILLLRELCDHHGQQIPPARQKRIEANLNRACTKRFESGMHGELMRRLRDGGGQVGPSEQMTLEQRARELRMLETTARRLSDGKTYDTLLAAGTAAVAAARRDGIVSRQGEIRLTEILAGTEAALRLYRLAPPAS